MALDSREKRANVSGIGRPWLRAPHPETIDEQWRISRGLAYGGNSLSVVAVVVAAGNIFVIGVDAAVFEAGADDAVFVAAIDDDEFDA